MTQTKQLSPEVLAAMIARQGEVCRVSHIQATDGPNAQAWNSLQVELLNSLVAQRIAAERAAAGQ